MLWLKCLVILHTGDYDMGPVIRSVSLEPPLLAHTSSESRGTFRQKARSLAPLNGWACAVKVCHNGMLEDTKSLDAAHMRYMNHKNLIFNLTLSIISTTRIILTNSPLQCFFWFCFFYLVGWLCWSLTSQLTIFQSCRDGAIASWVINQYFRGVKCLAQGHNTAAVGLEPRTSRSGVRHSTTEPPRSPFLFGF